MDMFSKLKCGCRGVKLKSLRLVIFAWIVAVTLTVFILGEDGMVVSWHIIKDTLQKRKTRLNCNVDWKNVSSLLGTTREDDLKKIRSYKFEGIQNYIDDLFPPETRALRQHDLPVFVSAFSSNHFDEGLSLVQNLRETAMNKYDGVKLIIFDLGLTRQQGNETRFHLDAELASAMFQNFLDKRQEAAVYILDISCSCEVRRFPFEKYPTHVRYLFNYAWKTIAIQIVAKEYPFVFWMDTSVRFQTNDLDSLFANVKKYGLLVHDNGSNFTTGTIAEHTHGSTFEFLDENPCAYSNQAEKEGTFIAIHASPFITQYFLRPWVSCALSVGCMDTGEVSSRFLHCPGNESPFAFQLCHRFDQSVLGILYTRLFHKNGTNPGISNGIYNICRGKSKDDLC